MTSLRLASRLQFVHFTSNIATGLINYNTSAGLDYSVRGIRSQSNSNLLTIIVLMNSDNRWINLRVSYFVESRADMWVGSFVGDLFSFSACLNNLNNVPLSTSVSTAVAGQFTQGASYYVQVMISGIRTSFNRFNVGLGNPTFNSSNGILEVSIQNASRQLELIYINYVIALIQPSVFNFTFFSHPSSSGVGSFQSIGIVSFSSANA